MCTRYYVAEGVRIYSQETWRRVMGSCGRSMVQRYIEPTVAYYRTATLADNHAVREAACACIAELAAKLEHPAVQPFVPTLLDTLLACFRDDSWPVRDGKILYELERIKQFLLKYSSTSIILHLRGQRMVGTLKR